MARYEEPLKWSPRRMLATWRLLDEERRRRRLELYEVMTVAQSIDEDAHKDLVARLGMI